MQLSFDHGAEVVHALDESRHLLQEYAVVGTFDAHRVFAVRFLNRLQLSLQYVLSLIDQADRIAHHLHLLHAVSGENDGGTLLAQLQHDVLEHDGVDRVKSGEGLIQNEQWRSVNDRGNELNLLLHSLGKVDHLLFRPIGELKSFQPVPRAPVGFPFRQPFQSAEKHQQFAHLHARIKAALFGQVPNPILSLFAERLAQYLDGPLVRDKDAHQHAQGG